MMQAVIDFIQAPTWEESKRFLESHRELLQPGIDVLLQELAVQQENDRTRESIEGYRLLLARCRDMESDAAFVEFQGAKSPEEAFVNELNRVCNEVVVTMRAGNAERQQRLATVIEQVLQEGLPVERARDFLQVLVAWVRGQDRQTLAERLQPHFRDAYAQMVAAVEQEGTQSADKDRPLAVEDLPR